MPQTSVIPQWRADYPILEPRQKPSGIIAVVTRTATAGAWATGVATITVPTTTDVVGSSYPMTISGFTPAGYNGSYVGTIASATTVTYPLAANPGGVATGFGTVVYNAVVPLVISTTLPANATPNDTAVGNPTIQIASMEPEQEEPERKELKRKEPEHKEPEHKDHKDPPQAKGKH